MATEIRVEFDELAAGKLRVAMARGVPILGLSDDVVSLARVYHAELQLPPKSGNDILHIAFGVAYDIDYLLTWNCAHIANGHTIRRLAAVNERLGRRTPVIVTPEELLED